MDTAGPVPQHVRSCQKRNRFTGSAPSSYPVCLWPRAPQGLTVPIVCYPPLVLRIAYLHSGSAMMPQESWALNGAIQTPARSLPIGVDSSAAHRTGACRKRSSLLAGAILPLADKGMEQTPPVSTPTPVTPAEAPPTAPPSAPKPAPKPAKKKGAKKRAKKKGKKR